MKPSTKAFVFSLIWLATASIVTFKMGLPSQFELGAFVFLQGVGLICSALERG